MAVPDFPKEGPVWDQLAYGVAVGGAALAWIVQQVVAGRKDVKKGRVELEVAELADLGVVRNLAPKLEEAIKLGQRITDLLEGQEMAAEREKRILDILDRMDRKEQTLALIREELIEHEKRGTPRR